MASKCQGGGADEMQAPPAMIGSAVAGAACMVTSGAGFMVRRTFVAAEHAAVGVHSIAGADDANAISAGALHHIDIDAHSIIPHWSVSGSKTCSIMLVSIAATWQSGRS